MGIRANHHHLVTTGGYTLACNACQDAGGGYAQAAWLIPAEEHLVGRENFGCNVPRCPAQFPSIHYDFDWSPENGEAV